MLTKEVVILAGYMQDGGNLGADLGASKAIGRRLNSVELLSVPE